ncbi:MAG: RluA family pseudouridine synthase [Rickettsiales bacterium]
MKHQYKIIPITKDEYEARLDRVVRKKFPYLNQGSIEKALRSKLILVNQQKVAANYRLALGDYVQVSLSLIKDNVFEPTRSIKINQEHLRLITDNIIFQDNNLMVINKPAGLAVQGGSGIRVSVDDIMPKILEMSETWSDEDSGHKLVHRLDKETSGILVIALNNATAKDLAYYFKHHQVEKQYLAILKGRLKTDQGQVSSIINKYDKVIHEDNAITNYRVLAKKAHASFVEFLPITGKTHQLRLHSLELGFPILGDSKYDPEYSDGLNLHLHAAEIAIPYEGTTLRLRAALPEYFKKNLKDIFGIKV